MRWALAAGLLVAACGGDAEENGDEGDIAGVQLDGSEASPPDDDGGSGSPGAGGCLLDEEAMSAAVGRTVRDAGPVSGGSGGMDGAATYSLSWEGCLYAAEDGTLYGLSALADAGSLDDLFALAETGDLATGGPVPDLGDAAFVDAEGRLVVLDGDATITLHVERAEPGTGDAEALRSIAASLVDLPEIVAVSALCTNAQQVLPDEWGRSVTNMATGGSGGSVSVGEVEATFEQCWVDLEGDGSYEDQLAFQLGDATLYDVLWETSGPDATSSAPVPIDDLGDGALWTNSRLHVRVGDQGLVIEAATADDEPLPREQVLALAPAIIAATTP